MKVLLKYIIVFIIGLLITNLVSFLFDQEDYDLVQSVLDNIPLCYMLCFYLYFIEKGQRIKNIKNLTFIYVGIFLLLLNIFSTYLLAPESYSFQRSTMGAIVVYAVFVAMMFIIQKKENKGS